MSKSVIATFIHGKRVSVSVSRVRTAERTTRKTEGWMRRTFVSISIDHPGDEVFLTIIPCCITTSPDFDREPNQMSYPSLSAIVEPYRTRRTGRTARWIQGGAYRMATSSSVKSEVESSGSYKLQNRMTRSARDRDHSGSEENLPPSQIWRTLSTARSASRERQLGVKVWGGGVRDEQLAWRTVPAALRRAAFRWKILEIDVFILSCCV